MFTVRILQLREIRQFSGGPTNLVPALTCFFLLIILATVFFRFTGLQEIPPGAYVDETSIGYNAYSILQTGADEHGVSFPLFFKAFGEYKNPVFIYALIPLIKLFDLSVWTIRLGAALFGLGTAILLGFIVKENMPGKFAWAIGFTLASAMPWLFTLSRISFEVISLPFLVALAWWSWLKAIRLRSLIWFALSWSAWGMSLFAYSTARLIIPVLAAALLVSYRSELKAIWKQCAIPFIFFALCVIILLYWSLTHPGSLTARFSEITIWTGYRDIVPFTYKFVRNYLTYFSFDFLFLNGDPNLRHHTGRGGELFLSMLPVLLAGLIYAWHCRHQALHRFTLLGFLFFPLAASLTVDNSHALRSANAIPFIVVLMAWGTRYLWNLSRARFLFHALLILATLEFASFSYDYFANYEYRARKWFNAGLPTALKVALEQRDSGSPGLYYSPLAFCDESSRANQPYIQFLFFGKFDPGEYRLKGLAGFNVYPFQEKKKLPKGSIVVLRDGNDVLTCKSEQRVLKRTMVPSRSELVLTIPVYSRGAADSSTFRIYRTL